LFFAVPLQPRSDSHVGTIVVVSSLYAYVLYVHEDQLGRRHPDLVKNSSFYDYVGHTPQLSPPSEYLSLEPQAYARHSRYSVAYSETLPTDIWPLYMVDATSVESVLGFPRSDRREFVPLAEYTQ
jgi:hypothetical protein